MHGKIVVAVTSFCSMALVTLLNSTYCFSQEGMATTESKSKKVTPLDRINVPDELYKQGLQYAQYGLF